jgi:uncharacterized Ntn-hydrolase superfamily protein
VAVQSHFFGVGSVVSWAEAGVGVVATQAGLFPDDGELIARLTRSGRMDVGPEPAASAE